MNDFFCHQEEMKSAEPGFLCTEKHFVYLI